LIVLYTLKDRLYEQDSQAPEHRDRREKYPAS